MRLTDTEFETAVGRYGDTVFRLAYSYLKNLSLIHISEPTRP